MEILCAQFVNSYARDHHQLWAPDVKVFVSTVVFQGILKKSRNKIDFWGKKKIGK